MKIIERYPYPALSSETQSNGSRKYLTPTGALPSVTTILSATKDMTALKEWRARVGDATADRESREAANLGNLMHDHLERHILGQERRGGNNVIHKMARNMADEIINRGLGHVEEVWGVEAKLYFPHAYAGTSDLIGTYKGVPSIMDYKNSKKIKKREWIEDYFIQGAAYALAHNELYGTDIRQIVIFMASRELDFETFIVDESEFDVYTAQWIERMEQFFNIEGAE